MSEDVLERLRGICLALPEVSERLSHGEPTWFVREKRTVATFDDHHHNADRVAFWCPAPPGVQQELVAASPEKFFVPPYVGPSGWLGVRLDVDVDWAEVEEIVRDAYRKVAPKKLVAVLDA
ncbi:MAG: MmcQ/YjbR family DNA-binding protein [Sporichthyaceae bacterium]